MRQKLIELIESVSYYKSSDIGQLINLSFKTETLPKTDMYAEKAE